jgi:hypothetical protein
MNHIVPVIFSDRGSFSAESVGAVPACGVGTATRPPQDGP